jgi:alkaline phosphatase D
VHGRATYGDLATFHVLDTRQYRSPQVDGPHWQPDSPARTDPGRTMLGRTQGAWLAEGLARSTTTWNIIAQQVVAGRLDVEPGADLFNSDAWDGYGAAQARRNDGLARAVNPVVLTGDVHAAYALDVVRGPEGEPVAVELTATSISSGGDGAPMLPTGVAYRAANPHAHYVNQQRGFLRCRLEPGALTADFRTVPFVERPGAQIATDRSFTVEAGRFRRAIWAR